MSFQVNGIDHVEVYVRDLDASVRWYRDVLGLEEQMRWDPEPVMIGRGSTRLALFRAEAGARQSSEGLRFIRVAWSTDREGFQVAQKHLAALGISFRGPVDHCRAFSIYFTDPDGHPLEITTYDR